jgi:Holliday junction DNA helicase RuvB
MRDRMLEIHLAPYLDSEIAQIATRAFAVRGMTTDESTIAEITKRARATPRKVNEFAEYIRDLAQNRNSSAVPVALALQAFDMLEIDGLGLNALDRKYLHTIITKYDGGKVGIDTLAATMSEDRNALVKMTEPYLLATGLIEVAKGGRVATQAAYRHLNIES